MLKVSDILEDLGIARSTFDDWKAKGRLPAYIKLPNGSLRFRQDAYEAWLRRLEQHAKSEGR